MKVIATNIGKRTKVIWNNREIETGIFKYPVDEPILLEKENVAKDAVIDRKHHGGEHKACYLYASDYYPYWKDKYPHLNWNWGMFGENLTVEGLDESEITIGSIYNIGTATVQITEPRQPCHKLGIRFEDQNVLKEFIDYNRPGTYVRILKNGHVSKNDALELVRHAGNTITVQEYNILINSREKDKRLVKLAIDNDSIRVKKRELLKKYI